MASPLTIAVRTDISAARQGLSELKRELQSVKQAAEGGAVKPQVDGKALTQQLKKEQEAIRAAARMYEAAEKTKQEQIKATAKASKQASSVQKKSAASATLTEQRYITALSKSATAQEALTRAQTGTARQMAEQSQRRIQLLNEQYQRESENVRRLTEEHREAAETRAVIDDMFMADEATMQQRTAAVTLETDAQNRLAQAERQRGQALSNLEREQSRVTAEADKMAAATQNAAEQQGILNRNVQGARYALYQIAAAYGAASAAALGFAGSSVKASIAQEKAFAQVARTTEGTVAELEPLRNTLRDISTEIPVVFEDLAKITELGGQMGFSVSELPEFTETVARFAASTGVAVDTAATSFGKLSNLLHVGVQDFEALGSAIAQVGVTTVATDAQIIKTSSELAGVGYAAGISTEGVIGLAAAFASLDVQPERARSAVLRFFRNVDLAIEDGGEALQIWADQLSMTRDELIELRDTDADAFFTRFIGSLEEASDSGERLTSVFNKLGIDQVRDYDAFSRMAGGYNLLTDAIEESTIAYARAGFLVEASDKVFSTVAGQIDVMRNAWENFRAGIGDTRTLNRPIQLFVKGVTSIIELLDMLGPGFKAAVGSFAVLLGMFTAYRAGIALLIAGTLAFRYVFQNGMAASGISLRGLMTEIENTRKAMRAKTAEAVSGSNAAVAGVQKEIAAQRQLSGMIRTRPTASGLHVSTEAAGAAASTAARGVGSFIGSFAGMATITLATSAIMGVTESIVSLATTASREEKRIAEFQDSMIEAAGGAASFRQALDEDNQAIKATTSNLEDATASLGQIYQRYEALEDSQRRVRITRVFEDAAGGVHELSEEYSTSLGPASEFIEALKGIKGATEDANGAIILQRQFLDEASEAWINNMFQQELLDPQTDFDVELLSRVANLLDKAYIELDVPEDQKINITDIMFTSATAGEEAALKLVQQVIDTLGISGRALTLDPLESGRWYEVIDVMMRYAKETRGIVGPLSEAADMAGRFGAEAAEADDKLESFTSELEEGTETAKDFADAVRMGSDALDDLIDSVFESDRLTGDLAAAYEKLGESIAKNGDSFDVMTEAGRANLAAFEQVVRAHGAILQAEYEAGNISGYEAGQMMAVYMQDLMAQLAQMEIPTDQIDKLVDILNQVTGHDWMISVGADVSGAISGLQEVSRAAADVGMQMLSIGTDLWGMPVGPVAMAPLGGYKTKFAPTPSSTLSDIMGSGYRGGLSAGRGGGGASKAGKEAAKETEDAMKAAEQAAKDLEDAFKRLIETIKNASKSMFEHVSAEGAVFEAQKKLLMGIEENGRRFTTATDAGRANLANLEGLMSSYAQLQATRLRDGEITSKKAQKNITNYAGIVRQFLLQMDVGERQINRFFKGFGVNVNQVTKANKQNKAFNIGLRATVRALRDQTIAMMDAAEKSKIYADALKKAFDEINMNVFGRSNAADAITRSYNAMADSIAQVNEEIERLRKESAEFDTIIAGQEAIAQGAGYAYAQALAAGDTELAGIFAYQRDTAQQQVSRAKEERDARQQQIKDLEASRNATEGYTDAALDNRAALQSLMGLYQDQIVMYAQTGDGVHKVRKFTQESIDTFVEQAKQLGFNEDQLQDYIRALNMTMEATQNITRKGAVKAQVELSVSDMVDNEVARALKGKKMLITPEMRETKQFRQAFNQITKDRNAVIRAVRDKNAADRAVNQLNNVAKNRNARVTPVIPAKELQSVRATLRNLQGTANVKVNLTPGKGASAILLGAIGGGRAFARGGLVPGTPPSDPLRDNVLAGGKDGLFAIQSGEYVTQRRAVDYYGVPFMNAINEMRIPRQNFSDLTKAINGINTQTPSGGDMTIINHYPQAEPTSRTINRARALATGMGRF